jgi:hypothetical protein
MKPTKLVHRLLLAILAIIVPLVFLAARDLRSEASVRVRIASILASLAAPMCMTRCTTFDCEGMEHENHYGGAVADGPVHTCGYNEGGCAWHQQQCTKDGPVIGQLPELIESLDGDGILYFVEAAEAFTLNADRRAVQILGCDGNVFLSKNLTPTQALDLPLDK